MSDELLGGIAGALLLLLEDRTEWIDSPAYRDLRKAMFPFENRSEMPRTRREVRSGIRGKELLKLRHGSEEKS